MSSTPKVLRVFLSSTAIDMTGCREKVRDTILQLQQLPIGMETFTALPRMPAADCQAEAARSDVVVVPVAYRYSYVPGDDLGGELFDIRRRWVPCIRGQSCHAFATFP